MLRDKKVIDTIRNGEYSFYGKLSELYDKFKNKEEAVEGSLFKDPEVFQTVQVDLLLISSWLFFALENDNNFLDHLNSVLAIADNNKSLLGMNSVEDLGELISLAEQGKGFRSNSLFKAQLELAYSELYTAFGGAFINRSFTSRSQLLAQYLNNLGQQNPLNREAFIAQSVINIPSYIAIDDLSQRLDKPFNVFSRTKIQKGFQDARIDAVNMEAFARKAKAFYPQKSYEELLRVLINILDDFNLIGITFDANNGDKGTFGGGDSKKIWAAFDQWFNPKKDPAQSADIQGKDKSAFQKGGIDLNTDKMDLEARNQGEPIRFKVDAAQIKALQDAPGFMPVIINISPLIDLRMFLGLTENAKGSKAG